MVVISGGLGYVGSAVAKHCAEKGFAVAVLYRSDTEESAAAFINSLVGDTHAAYKCDLTDAAQVADALEKIEATQGVLYAAVHAAGSMPLLKPLHMVEPSEFDMEMKEQAGSGFIFLSGVARLLKAHKGGVLVGITTAAVATLVNTKARGIYSPIKFALQGVLAAFKEELAPFGVRVYSVAPGVMPGGLNRKTPQAFLDMVRALIPNKTLATADDVAAQVSYLLLDKSQYETGFTFLVAPETKV